MKGTLNSSRPMARLGWRVENATRRDEADVYIYDVIGDPWGEGVDATEFVRELQALDAKRINFHINSPGGVVNDALAMFTAIQSHPAECVGYVEGSADSSASFVLQAMDHRVIAKNASVAIHEAHTFAFGTPEDFRQIASALDEESDNIASIYADRCGGTRDEWRSRMKANGGSLGSKYRGEAAVDIGLADEVGMPTRNRLPLQVAAQTTQTPGESDELDDLVVSLMPRMADLAGYQKPDVPLEHLLAANPIGVK